MDNDLIEKYKAEMLNIYRSKKAVPTAATVEASPKPTPSPTSPPQGSPATEAESNGRLIAIVTTLRTLYPVEGARVTVFTGDYKNPQIIKTVTSDQSGRTEEIPLSAPTKELSLEAENKIPPYALYNLLVEAEGYLDNIHLNVPIFSGVTSLQRSNMLLKETSGVNKGPQIFDESQQFNL